MLPFCSNLDIGIVCDTAATSGGQDNDEAKLQRRARQSVP
jgi:hypothetical protein